jgi:biopolymer transport protein ExbB
MQFMDRPRHNDVRSLERTRILALAVLIMLTWCAPLAAQTSNGPDAAAAAAQNAERAAPDTTSPADETASSRTATDKPPAEGAPPTEIRVSSPDGKSPLPHELSVPSMFMSADIVVKAVMISLLLASICSLSVWLAKTFIVWRSGHALRADLARLHHLPTLTDAAAGIGGRSHIALAMVGEAAREVELSSGLADRASIKERVASRLDVIETAVARSMRTGTGLLASVGATAPFVGLFGTVWGIMNSFIGISKSQTTNLAVVAPGIAEALLATAIGLVAAIPAVLFYNALTRALASHRALTRATSAEVQRIVSRDLDRNASRPVAGKIRLAAE